MKKLKVIWKVLTTDDWFIVSKEPPEMPFTLWVGNIEVRYHIKKSDLS